MPSIKRKVKAQPVGAPLWIVTYGDLMTLLLTFFVLLLSFSAIKMDSFRAAMGSLREALGVFQGSQSVLYAPADVTSNIPTKAEILKATAEIRALLRERNLEKMVEMELTGEGIRFKLNSSLLFGSGRAELNADVFDLMENIGYLTNRFATKVIVEGHTDDLPLTGGIFKSNWGLSAARAVSVVNFLSNLSNTKKDIFQVSAFSEYKPRVTNDSPENRALNRRVEIMIKLHNPPKNYTDEEIDTLLRFIQPVGEEIDESYLDTLRSF